MTALAFGPDTPASSPPGHDDGAGHRLLGLLGRCRGHQPVFRKEPDLPRSRSSAPSPSAPTARNSPSPAKTKPLAIWDLNAGKYIGCLSGHTDRISSLAWHPSGKFLVSAGWDTTARVWDANTLQPVILLNSHATQVNAAAFSPDGRRLACCPIRAMRSICGTSTAKRRSTRSRSRTPRFARSLSAPTANSWPPKTRRSHHPRVECRDRSTLRRHLPAPAGQDHGIGPPRRRAASSATAAAMRRASGTFSDRAREPIATLETDETIHALAYSRDGKWIAGAAGNKVRVWDSQGKHLADWDGPEEPITIRCASAPIRPPSPPAARALACGSWRVTDGEPILLSFPDSHHRLLDRDRSPSCPTTRRWRSVASIG